MEFSTDPNEMPRYVDLVLPTLRAVEALGGSAKAGEITSRILEDLQPPDDVVAVTYPNSDKSVLLSRMDWARSYCKLFGALESPRRGVFLLAPLGQELLAMEPNEAAERVIELDRNVRTERRKLSAVTATSDDAEMSRAHADDDSIEGDGIDGDGIDEDTTDWKQTLLQRLHRLSPEGFEEFVLYLLRLYDLELKRVGGSGDEGIDGIGTAPISPVLSSRVAVQVKRYNPDGKPVGREVVALFQRDAQTKGAERAILVTLGRFTEPARQAAIATTPTVDLIDGERLADLILEKEAGVRFAPVVDERWFDRWDRAR